MSEVVKLRTRAEIDEEAAAWIWRMESGPSGAADAAGFEAWLRQDPRHRRAVEELTRVWDALDGLAGLHRAGSMTDLSGSGSGAHVAAVRGRRHWLLAAAAVLIATVGGVAWLYRGNETQILATAVGQHRHLTLSDGTVVTLNTNTIVETNFGRRAREIYLRKGEAHFEVAQDRLRPFLVHAGDAVVRAIGTEFEVRVRADRHVDVLVTEGRVEVEPDVPDAQPRAAGAAAEPVPVVSVRAVNAGQQLSTATTDYTVVPVSPEQLSSELAWRDGAVVFDSEPLGQAIAEIQRYTDARIIVSDPSIGALPVGGRFRTDDLQGFLDGLETALPVTIRRTPDGLVYVDPRR
jgi:transmembrane sensor